MKYLYDYLTLLADSQWHSYLDILVLGCNTLDINEKRFRKHLKRFVEYNLIAVRSKDDMRIRLYEDYYDLEFHLTEKGDKAFNDLKTLSEGTEWVSEYLRLQRARKRLGQTQLKF